MKKTSKTFSMDSFRTAFSAAQDNFDLQRVVDESTPEDAKPSTAKLKNLATRSKIAAKFSALEDVDISYLSERMTQDEIEGIPTLPVKLQQRVLDAARFLRGAGKNSVPVLRAVMKTVQKKPGLEFTSLVSSVMSECGYTKDTAMSRSRNAVNSLVALGVVATDGNGFSTKGAHYSPADSDFASEAFNNL